MGDDMKKKVNELIRLLHKQGWTVSTPGASKHYKARGPNGEWATLPTSPSDPRTYLNLVAELRRRGVDIPHRKKGR